MNKFDTLYQQIILEYAETCQIDCEVPYKDYLIKVTCINNQDDKKEYTYEITKDGEVIHQSRADLAYISRNQALSFAKSLIENLSNKIPNPSKKYAKLIGPKGKNIFESESVTDVELFGNDVYNSILKVYEFNGEDFNDVSMEVTNFKFLVPNNDVLADYKLEENQLSTDLDIKKIIVFDKETNKILFDIICLSKDVERILENIDYVKVKENRSFDPYLSIGLYGTVELMQDKQTKKFLAKPVSEFEYIDLDANTKEEAEKEIFIRWPTEANKE